MQFLIDTVRHWLQTNPARLIAWIGGGAVAAAVYLADQIGVVIPPEVQDAISVVSFFVVGELIRRLVYSPATARNLAERVPNTAPDPGLPTA